MKKKKKKQTKKEIEEQERKEKELEKKNFDETFKDKEKINNDEVLEFLLKKNHKIEYSEAQNFLKKTDDDLTIEEMEFLDEYRLFKKILKLKFKDVEVFDKNLIRDYYFGSQFEKDIEKYFEDELKDIENENKINDKHDEL